MKDKDINHGLKMAGVVVLGLLALFLFIKTINEVKTFETIGADPNEMSRTIAVSGKSEIKAVPDVATFNLTVEEESTSSMADAKSKAATKINAILAYLEKEGVEKKNITSTSYTAYPKYKTVTRPCSASAGMDDSVSSISAAPAAAPRAVAAPAYPCTNSDQVASGYIVSQSLEVKLLNYKADDNQLGKLISGVTDLKAKYVSNSYFTIENIEKLQQQARTEAIAKARAEAQVLARSLGVRLGRVVSFSDGGYYPYAAAMSARAEKVMDSEAGAPVPEMPTGEQTITSSVTVSYTIK